MKTVYSSNKEIAHIWANNDNATINKKASSMSCQFDRLFSYSTCIAEIVGDTVIFNTYSYSPTTSKHQSYAQGAIHGKARINLEIPNYGLSTLVFSQDSFNELVVSTNHKRIAQLLVKAERARLNGGRYQGEAFSIEQNLKQYAALLNLQYTPLDLDQFKGEAVALDKARKVQEKARQAEKIKEQAENLENWRAGADIRAYFEITALRIKNDEIETSKGAKIPLDHAVRAYPLIKRLHDRDLSLDLSSHAIKLGHYTVNRIEKDNLIVGCHKIPYSEIEKIAIQLNLMKEEQTA